MDQFNPLLRLRVSFILCHKMLQNITFLMLENYVWATITFDWEPYVMARANTLIFFAAVQTTVHYGRFVDDKVLAAIWKH